MNSKLILAATMLLPLALAQQPKPFEYWPGTQYETSIPTPRQVLGYDFGDRITWSGNAVRYFDTLAAAAPSRMKVWDYAKSWKGGGSYTG